MRYKRQGMGDGGLEIRDRRLKAAQFIFVFFLLDKKVTINILSDLYANTFINRKLLLELLLTIT